ncbi:hypothetical protein SAMN02799630_01105 [Paenibacillus sp. UNCCL117]|uniref:hypothetical protein n=1 Tax=unclassified Paenibacillus TaxID=185978 RepID=UPI000890BA73|nr:MULTISPECIES: hypothetical protein [unclassified Paenibacillus]SDC66047.1 hypothetical protein SAMN04488602_10383 [Paenibacillus sp. cl123]SFW22937.1 hypothetical protein SAMN02799630_01105 [Paenibacillus sp. UNCCL117]
MNPFMKKLTAGTLAVGVLASGAGVYYTQAFAAASDTSANTDSGSGAVKAPGERGAGLGSRGPRGGGFGHGGGSLVEQTATLLGVESSVILEELKQQKTLAQIALEKAGLGEAAYVQKLVDAETAKLTESVTAGKLTQAQADEKLAALTERIQKEVTATGGKAFKPAGPEGTADERPGKDGFPGGGKGHGGLGHFGNTETLAGLLGLTKDELSAALKEGRTLAEIAADKGIDKDTLVGKIKDSLDTSIREFVDRKQTGRERSAPAAAPGTAAEGAAETGA